MTKHSIGATVNILKLNYKLIETIVSDSCANVNSNCGADWDMWKASDSNSNVSGSVIDILQIERSRGDWESII